MKKTTFTFFSFILFLSFSCEKDLFNPKPPNELPPATMTGEGTFGCLVNGEVWRPYIEDDPFESRIYAKHDRGWPDCDQLFVSGTRNLTKNDVTIFQSMSINSWCPELGANKITFSKGRYRDLEGCGEYYLDTLSPHILYITKLDTINYIASGTFELTVINDDCKDTIKITEGRFDVNSRL